MNINLLLHHRHRHLEYWPIQHFPKENLFDFNFIINKLHHFSQKNICLRNIKKLGL